MSQLFSEVADEDSPVEGAHLTIGRDEAGLADQRAVTAIASVVDEQAAGLLPT